MGICFLCGKNAEYRTVTDDGLQYICDECMEKEEIIVVQKSRTSVIQLQINQKEINIKKYTWKNIDDGTVSIEIFFDREQL